MTSVPDTAVLTALEPYEDIASARLKAIVGYTDVLLDNDNFKCRLQECNIGNLIADAYVDYVRLIKCLLISVVYFLFKITDFCIQYERNIQSTIILQII